MFVFEDIVNLDNRSIQRIIRDVENTDLQLALKVASEEVRDAIFRNMSKRMAESFKEEMEYMGPVRLRDVEEAQTRIVATIAVWKRPGKSLSPAAEVTISLSNLIKSSLYVPLADSLEARTGPSRRQVRQHRPMRKLLQRAGRIQTPCGTKS